MLSLCGISRRYGDVSALDGLNLNVPANRYVSLLGASGAGKTTLLRLIAGFEEPDTGHITLNDRQLDGVPTHRRGVGFVFQNFALFPHLSVEQNVGYGLKYRVDNPVTDKTECRDRVQAMLQLVGLDGLGGRGVGAISGGQRQRVALARTLVTEPRIVLLDEPLGALDANLRDRMCDELRAIRERLGVTFLHVTGSETEALTMGDEVAVLADGRITQYGPAAELFERPANAAAARHLNAYNLLSGRVARGAFQAGAGILPLTQTLPDGTSGELAVRFDRIGVVSQPQDVPTGHDHFTARFLTAEFNGPTILAFFRTVDGGLVQVVDHQARPRLGALTEGETYALHFDPAGAILFTERAA